ncbi:MAG: hypothetical protein EP329_18580 [Deltaproteobacteria bacterium]|nr:MAG: hypothetical protein EP329_18580 [Deltaproteobacteria bacterium]
MHVQPFPTAESILEEVEGRALLVARMFEASDTLSDEDWSWLVYYAERNATARGAFVNAIVGISAGGDADALVADLPPHGRWLAAVYTAVPLTSEWCAGGSRFHKRVMDQFGGSVSPGRVLREIRGLKPALKELQARLPQFDPKLLENIAIDETFEQLGRHMLP